MSLALFHALIGVGFTAAFGFDFLRSSDLPRRASNLLGLFAVALAVIGVTTALDVGMVPLMMLVLALVGHVIARATDSTARLDRGLR